jgi:hypothetical protein
MVTERSLPYTRPCSPVRDSDTAIMNFRIFASIFKFQDAWYAFTTSAAFQSEHVVDVSVAGAQGDFGHVISAPLTWITPKTFEISLDECFFFDISIFNRHAGVSRSSLAFLRDPRLKISGNFEAEVSCFLTLEFEVTREFISQRKKVELYSFSGSRSNSLVSSIQIDHK